MRDYSLACKNRLANVELRVVDGMQGIANCRSRHRTAGRLRTYKFIQGSTQMVRWAHDREMLTGPRAYRTSVDKLCESSAHLGTLVACTQLLARARSRRRHQGRTAGLT
jgi:hypothetical protein